MAEVDGRFLPALIKKDSKAIKRAGIKTLNTIAFDAQKGIVQRADKDMDFRLNARRAMGITVKTANQGKLEAQVFTKRGWLHYHLDEGQRGTSQGFRWNGRGYILVPIESAAFTKKKRLKAKYRGNLFIIPQGRDGLVFFRPKRGKGNILIGILKPRVEYHEDIEPDKVVNKMFKEKATRLFKFYLKK